MTHTCKDILRRSQIFTNPKPSQMAILFTRLWLHFLLFLTPQHILQNFVATSNIRDCYHISLHTLQLLYLG